MSDDNNLHRRAPRAATGRGFAVIGGVVVVAAVAFAYAGGWLTPNRLTPDRMVAALANRGGNPAGHRRNHSKGMCFVTVRSAPPGSRSRRGYNPCQAASR